MNSSALYTGIGVVLAIIIVAAFFFFPNYLRGTGSGTAASAGTPPSGTAPASAASANPNALQVNDVTVGTGATAEPGDVVEVEYIGKLQDGTIFDQSSAHTEVMPGCPAAGMFCFTLGANQVISGWDQGLVGMKVGGERILTIPPSLGYGNQANGPIPANSTLIFDVKLIGIQPASGSSAQ